MWSYFPDLLATPVPRYTSYPTAAEFHDGVGAADQRTALERIATDEPLSLYVHIPFCEKICFYCGCNTGAANRTARLATYLHRLDQEIALVAEVLSGRGRVARVAFGGGSPNAISAAELEQLAGVLRDRFLVEPHAIWSIEVDPRSLDEEFADAMGRVGIERASLGVQTFDERVQHSIGRVQPEAMIEKSVSLLRAAGVTSLNFDLMYGLPGQDLAMLTDSLARSDDLGADRLAVFGYAHVPHLIARQRKIDGSALPDAETRFEMAATAYRQLTVSGWVTVGFDHFAKAVDPLAATAQDGKLRRNFQGFTDDPCQVSIGFGSSAISRLPGLLVQNEKNNGRYALKVGNGQLAGSRGISLSSGEERRAHLIEELLCSGSADLAPLPDLPEIRDRLEKFANRGLIVWSGSILSIAPHGLPYARSVAAALDPWRAQSTVRFSSAV